MSKKREELPPSESELIRAIIQKARAGETVEATPLEELDPATRLRHRDFEQDIILKRRYANILLWAMIGQVAAADVVFILYAHFGAHWKLSGSVINVWLGATLIEVIGVVLVVTRYLFPHRDSPLT